MKKINRENLVIFRRGFLSKRMIQGYILIWILLLLFLKKFYMLYDVKVALWIFKFMLGIAFAFYFNSEVYKLLLFAELKIDLKEKIIQIHTCKAKKSIAIKELDKILIEKMSDKSENEISYYRIIFYVTNGEEYAWGYEIHDVGLQEMKHMILEIGGLL